MSTGGVKPRLLTRAEYLASLQSLFGTVTTPLDLPPDTSVAGFVSVGAALTTVNATAADQYETVSRAVVAEVFGDMARYQALVGCQPQADLSDACVETFARAFGGRAYRRDLTDKELARWVGVARGAAALADDPVQGLSTMVSGILQSPNFLYRFETNAFNPANGRLKYDGPSMAVRLAYFLTGGPPSAELVAAGESGRFDTADGVRTASASMLGNPALVGQLLSFFSEYTQVELVTVVNKSAALFPEFSDSLRSSMRESTRLFLENVVLAPGADVRSFFDSDQFFVNAELAPLYGVTSPASGFAKLTLEPASGRAGIHYIGLNMGTVSENLAHRGPYDFLPPERDPTRLFNALFGTGAPGAPADISGALRRSVLDAVLDEANNVKATLGTVDARRIEEHMESIRAIELRIPDTMVDGGAPGGCHAPDAPPVTLADMTAKSQAMNRLITAAVACNLTRVYTHLWSGARDDNQYPTIPVNAEHHSLTHEAKVAEHSKIEHYIMSQYADLARVMKETPMGAGSVLDNTLIYGVSEVAEPNSHVMRDFRIVLMGHAGGKLPGNRHLPLDGRKVTELMLTMQQVMGLPVNTFGSWDKTSKTMPEILA